MADDKKQMTVLSELQQLRGIVLGEYTIEIDQRLADIEHKMQTAQTDLVKAIDDTNSLGANEIQAVRDLIEDKMAAMTLNINQQLSEIKSQLAALQSSHVDRGQLGELLIAMGNQIQNQSAD
ncbi:MAG: putative phage tail protein [Cellvibrionaceae bacterium]|jgi:predicted phage tail protein